MGPTSSPIIFMAAFTGMGFTSRNRSFINCRYRRWFSRARAWFPSSQSATIWRHMAGITLA